MILALAPRTHARLDAIEAEEGTPQIEVVHEAVDVWSHPRGNDERREATWAILQIVARRAQETQLGAGGRT